MKSWGIAIISIGCISIMTAPTLMENYITMVIQGLVLVTVGFIMYKKSKKGDSKSANRKSIGSKLR